MSVVSKLQFTHASRSSHSWLSKQPQLVQSSKLLVASLSCAELGTAQPQLVNLHLFIFVHISDNWLSFITFLTIVNLHLLIFVRHCKHLLPRYNRSYQIKLQLRFTWGCAEVTWGFNNLRTWTKVWHSDGQTLEGLSDRLLNRPWKACNYVNIILLIYTYQDHVIHMFNKEGVLVVFKICGVHMTPRLAQRWRLLGNLLLTLLICWKVWRSCQLCTSATILAIWSGNPTHV